MTGNSGETNYEKIKIFKQTYTLPVLGGESFNALRGNIQQRQEIIKTGKRPERVFLLFTNKRQITFEERFAELDRLVKDYNKLINFLKTHREAYKSFFVSLTDELKEVVKEQLGRISNREQQRRNLELKFIQKNSSLDRIRSIQQKKAKISQVLFLSGNAFLLMLKKLEIISKGIDKLVNNQDKQKQILDKMVGELQDCKEEYDLDQGINEDLKMARELSQIAMDLEEILKPALGEFQGLIDQIVSIDGELNSTVSQVQDLVQNLTNSEGFFQFEGGNQVSDKLLDFLVINEQKKAILSDALNEAQAKTTDFLLSNNELLDECVEIDIAIENIQAQVGQQLSKMSENYRQTIDVSATAQVPFSNKDLGRSNPQLPISKGDLGRSNQQVPISNNDLSRSQQQVPISKGDLGGSQKSRIGLKSEKGIDYQPLEALLSQGKWQEADQKTADLMLEAMGKSSWWDVYSNDLLNFPNTDLRTMDQLWLNYSDGKFGFSVQKQIWLDCGGKVGEYNSDVYCRFADKVGWRKGGDERFVSYSQVVFNINAPHAHLPVCGLVECFWWGFKGHILSLFSALNYNT